MVNLTFARSCAWVLAYFQEVRKGFDWRASWPTAFGAAFTFRRLRKLIVQRGRAKVRFPPLPTFKLTQHRAWRACAIATRFWASLASVARPKHERRAAVGP